MTPDVQVILENAIRAPSGENCQPWRFIMSGAQIQVRLRPERDQSLYSWGQRASYMALGAALENIVCTARDLGYDTDIAYFPSSDKEHAATVTLARGNRQRDMLAQAIPLRASNRKPYRTEGLTASQRDALQEAAASLRYGSIRLIEDRGQIERLATVGSANEIVMLSNDKLHSFFFSHVNWTKEEDDRKKVGFYIKTLELPRPAEAIFRIIRHPSVIRLLRKVGFPNMIGKQNAAIYAASGAIGVIKGEGFEPIDFVKAGRVLERVWLAATDVGLSMQPLVGLLFLYLRVKAGDTADFSPQELRLIREAADVAHEVGGEDALFMFRIGHAEAPSARAVRFPLADSIEIV